jgi:hypothetical protein
MTYAVHQDNDEGNLTITHDRLVRLDTVEQSLAAEVSSAVEVAVIVDCAPAGHTSSSTPRGSRSTAPRP